MLDATVTRRSRSGDIIGPDQRVDVITALKAMTIWPAWQHHEEMAKGSIEVGKLADLVILSADPTAVDSETLDRIEVVETIKEGTTVYTMPKEDGGAQGLAGLVGSWMLVALRARFAVAFTIWVLRFPLSCWELFPTPTSHGNPLRTPRSTFDDHCRRPLPSTLRRTRPSM